MQRLDKLIVFELNEVPPRLLEECLKNPKLKGFKKIKSEGKYFKTFCNDKGELHPWSTWPTLHRGVNNNLHGINFINQPLKNAKNYPPIWEILLKNKITIGLFGSLQSYPPIKNKFVKFYLPDTFSPGFDAFPKKIEDFQKFNLSMAGDNKALPGKIGISKIFPMLNLIIKGYFSLKTISLITLHFSLELLSKKFKKKRHLFQSILSFDLYEKYLHNLKPEYSSFFSNHVASSMHRYWRDFFPNDFGISKGNKFNKSIILDSMRIADRQLNKLIPFCKKNNYSLLVLSSMGQERVFREDIKDLFLFSFKKLCDFLCLNKNDYYLKPAMQPDTCIVSKNKLAMSKLLEAINKVKDSEDQSLIIRTYNSIDLTTNIGLRTSKALNNNKKVYLEENAYPISKTGLKLVKRDIGTGYHFPLGIGLALGEISKKFEDLDGPIDTIKIKPLILDYFHIKDQ